MERLSLTRPNYATIRRMFWESHPQFKRRMVRVHNGYYRFATQNEYNTDTRCAWVDFVDSLYRNGEITQEQAGDVTLL